MSEEIVAIVGITSTIFGGIAFIKVFTDYFLRKRIIDKGLSGDDATKLLSKEQGLSSKFASLKWGLIILFGGLGLILSEAFGFAWENSAVPFGILAVCISAGFLVYYYIVKDKIQ